MFEMIRHRARPARLALATMAVLASTCINSGLRGEEQNQDDKPYTIMEGKVDLGTYNGFRRYHSHCHVCHGPDGLGSSYAPALVESLKTISYDEFSEAVVNGRSNVSQSQQSVMPAFGYVEDVMYNLDDIYSYLKARADDAIGRGRPERLPKTE